MSATKFGIEIGKKFEFKMIHSRKIYTNIMLNEQYRPYRINVM